ncbi:F0F1 ATP synthase subunit B [Periweissella ghanensis]|uniref:ATP synthase subunit b n=1 Tax=Periweissella ghanensis TaxID=467997 RepID=A0ABM8ZAX9_9LACO|nr:F0F1 ATP synthase subunit B [Periweissella ghanensis]MCM0601572.1 F0F1 ATP synthase subunit B [Periweissella ghanensis]CAH0418649.1 ATP synthase subunit b [Periweissella ghanensis]
MFSVDILASNQLYFGDMLFILASFALLLVLVRIFAWGPVTKMMQERADKIAADIDSAEDARKEAEDLVAKRQEQLKASRQEATTIVSDAKNQGNEQRQAIIDKAQADASSLKVSAQAEIEQARRDALASVQNEVADLSVQIATKIIQKELKLDDQKALIDSYIEGLGAHNEA